MDVLVAARAGDRLAAGLLDAVADVAGGPPTVAHSAAETELALRSRGRDVLVADPDVVPLSVAGSSGPLVVGWLGARSSARAAELLDAGAEDVLDASMGQAELVARLRRVCVRARSVLAEQPATYAELRVDARLRTAAWGERPLTLTPRELDVLQVLAAAGGRPVSREIIYRQVWRWAMPRGDRTVDVNVRRLRGKLLAAEVPVEIVTEPGIGYRVSLRDPDRDPDRVVTGL